MRLTSISENLLLRSASGNKRKGQLKHVTFEVAEQLWAADAPLSNVLFPIRGVVSLQVFAEDGKQVAIALVGPEGYAEVPHLFGAKHTRLVAVALTAGEAMLMKPEHFRAHLGEKRFRAGIEQYAQMFLVMLNRISVCHRIHVIDKTLIRMLLLLHDRSRSDSFQLTQDFLSRVIGVRKATISRAATDLRKAGAIGYDGRGRLHILNRQQLERQACSCYRAIKAESDRLISTLGGF
jgi:CRP-like cAMP-binding protein